MNFFITNREIIKNNNGIEAIREDGREHAGDNLRFGKYENGTFHLYPEPDSASDVVYSNMSEKTPETLKGSARFFKELYDELCKDTVAVNDVLFFIHGFNTDLDGVREAFKNLNQRYVDNPNCPIQHVIIFTWPGRSPDVPLHYSDDKKDAIRSGEALARGIEKLKLFFKQFLLNDENDPCGRDIHLMAHSMGNRVLKHTLMTLEENRIPIPEIFKEIFLMASDVEYDIFDTNKIFYKLIDFGERVHIYYHERDRVLDISKYTKNFTNRLGRYGRKTRVPELVDVFDINVTATADDRVYALLEKTFNHWYYYSSSDVVTDIINVMEGKHSGFLK